MSQKSVGQISTVLKTDMFETETYEVSVDVSPRQRITSHFQAFSSQPNYSISDLKFTTGFLRNYPHSLYFSIDRNLGITIRFEILNFIQNGNSAIIIASAIVRPILKSGGWGHVITLTFKNTGIITKSERIWDAVKNMWRDDSITYVSSVASSQIPETTWTNNLESLKLLLTVQLEHRGKFSIVSEPDILDTTLPSMEIYTKKYFLAESMSDVMIIDKNGDQLPAHRLILSGRSPVFELMFQQKMKETIEGRVVIDDIEADVLKELLHFIYANELTNISVWKTKAIDLWISAHKYQIENLKIQCVKHIGASITLENALKVYNLGDLYKEHGLINKSLEIMKKHKVKIIEDNAENLGEFTNKYPNLAWELFKT